MLMIVRLMIYNADDYDADDYDVCMSEKKFGLKYNFI